LSIAQAFMEGRRLLLLDEAFDGLDESSVHRIRVLLEALREEGRTILLTSHNQGDIDAVCDDVWRVEQQGLVLASGRAAAACRAGDGSGALTSGTATPRRAQPPSSSTRIASCSRLVTCSL